MKKQSILLLSLVMIFTISLSACYSNDNSSFDSAENQEKNSENTEFEEPSALPPMVMLDGIIYKDTGYVNSMLKCGTYDDTIKSSVNAYEKPTKDNQSNFGQGFGYQKWHDYIIVQMLDKKWYIFKNIEDDSTEIPEGVCNFTALIKEVLEDDFVIKVNVLEFPEEFGYIPFPNDDKNALIRVRADNLVYPENQKDNLDTKNLIDKKVRVWFDGDEETFQSGYLLNTYRIEFVE